MSFLTEAVTGVVTDLTTANIATVTDPRAARPGVVFVEMPTFNGVSENIVDMTITLRYLAPGPGNQISADASLEAVDAILNVFGGAITSGRATAAIIGDQTLPAYDLTLRIVTRRDPPAPPAP